TNDDAVRTHTQTVDYQLALRHGAFAFNVWRARFQSNNVFLVKLQFGCVFDRDDALFVRNVRGKDIEKSRLAGTCSARNKDIETGFYAPSQELTHGLCKRPIMDDSVCRNAL